MKNWKTVITFCVSLGIALAWSQVWSQEISVVSPISLADAEGNGNATGSGQRTRFHMLFPAADFLPLPQTHRTINRIAWRPDQENALTIPVGGPATIRLATTTAESLSPTFANNLTLGTGVTVVFDEMVSWQTNNDPAAGPRSFEDFTFQLQTPFTYDPNAGNLLMEFVGQSDWSTVGGDFLLDTHLIDSTDITFVGAPNPSASDGVNVFPGIIPTQFTFVVPEPSTGLLAGLALLVVPAVCRRRIREGTASKEYRRKCQ